MTSKRELAKLVRRFLDGSIGKWEWDDFTSVPQGDPEVETFRLKLVAIQDDYPAEHSGYYCNDEGLRQLAEIAVYLETSASQQ